MSNWQGERSDIRRAGLRATPSRMAVLRLLRTLGLPLTHAEVADQLGEAAWDRATLYRNLIDLADAGLLRRISLSDGMRFEVVEQHLNEAPVHFVCEQCEQVQCLPGVALPVAGRRGLPKAVSRGEVQIQVRGVCDTCLV